MRFTIILALCFIGAASASSLNKRSFLDDLQNKHQNAFHAFEQFGQNFNEKVQEALKNLFSAFGNKTQSTEASVSVSKRAVNPLELIADLGRHDLAKFSQDFLKLLMDVATLQGRRKRDIHENIQKFSEEAKHNTAEALKKLFALFEQFKPQSSESSDVVTVAKRDVNPLELIADLGRHDLVKFSQDFLKLLMDVATLQGRRKRDIHENIQKFSEEAKHNTAEALKKLFALFEQFKPQSSESSDAVTVAKRGVNPLELIADLGRHDLAKFSQDFLKLLMDVVTLQSGR